MNNFPKFVIKKCIDCGLEKECNWKHYFTSKGKPVYLSRCKECHNQYLRKNLKKNHVFRQQSRKILWRRKKEKCIKLFGGKCQKCGYNKSLSALSFHHRDRSSKLDEISKMIKRYDLNNKIFKEELRKCDLLCLNCHMETEEELRHDNTQSQNRPKQRSSRTNTTSINLQN